MSAPDLVYDAFWPHQFQKATSLRLSWGPAEGATSYEVGIGASAYQSQLNPIEVPTGRTYLFKGLFPATNYYGAVRGKNADGVSSGWFVTQMATPVAQGIHPRYGEFIRLRQITDAWIEWEEINGNDIQPDYYDGGRIRG